MNNTKRTERIRNQLNESFNPIELDIEDQSHLHIGHPGAKEGAGHYAVRIVSKSFEGKNEIERHRMIYAALSEMLPKEIHALSIKTDTP